MEAFGITRSSAKHYWIERQQSQGDEAKHHPEEKRVQIETVLSGRSSLSIYEVYGGHGYCTGVYQQFGTVTSRTVEDGNDWHVLHAELASRRTYDVVDVDGYGYPSRILASGAVELLGSEGVLFVTFPVFGANHVSGITTAHLKLFYGTDRPEIEDLVRSVKAHALAYHRLADVRHVAKLGRIWRVAFDVRRVPATLLYGVRNRPDAEVNVAMVLDVPAIYPDLEVASKPARVPPRGTPDGGVLDLFADDGE
jgi:hypothetical protein